MNTVMLRYGHHCMKTRLILPLLVLLALALVVASAQEPIEPVGNTNPQANLSWPPPVYVLRGQVELRGTANLDNMTIYFVEYRSLLLGEDVDPDAAEARPWLPASLPAGLPVLNDVLGTWDTTTVDDGLYELRLTINTTSGPVFSRVSPVRVENMPPEFVMLELIQQQEAALTPGAPARPTLAPTPTPLSRDPMATALVDANVRAGDGVGYERIASLLTGQTVPIVGISAYGSGWYLIQLSDGRRGWVAPSVVRAEGDMSTVPRVNPPATPTPVPTNTPVSTVNLIITTMNTVPAVPNCAEAFTLFVTVQNVGTGTSPSGIVGAFNTHDATGTVRATTIGGFPALGPGSSFTMSIPMTVDIYYNERHTITVTIDPTGQIAETNKNDNVATLSYTLAQAACP